MNKWKYSLKRLLKNKQSSCLMIALTFVLSCAVIFSSVILNTCDKYKEKNFNPYSDYYRLMRDEYGYAVITENTSEKEKYIIENAGYTDKDFMISATSSSINTILEYFLDITDYYMETDAPTRSSKMEPSVPAWWKKGDFFNMHGVPDASALTVFLRGEKVLVDGRYITAEDVENKSRVCMISDVVAELNGIKVGDVVDMIDPMTLDETGYFGEYVDFTVVGIYHDYGEQYPSLINVPDSNYIKENHVYVPISIFEKKDGFVAYNFQIKVDDESVIPKMEELINKYRLVMGKAYLVKVEEIFETNVEELKSLETIFTIVQYSVIFLSGLLMILYLYSSIIARKRECGVLLGIGQSKTEVFSGILIESGICVIIGIIMAVILTSYTSGDLAEIIYNFVNKNKSADTLSMSTSDSVALLVNEKKQIGGLFDTTFVGESIVNGALLLIPIYAVGFASAAIAIARINVMKLLTKEES